MRYKYDIVYEIYWRQFVTLRQVGVEFSFMMLLWLVLSIDDR